MSVEMRSRRERASAMNSHMKGKTMTTVRVSASISKEEAANGGRRSIALVTQ